MIEIEVDGFVIIPTNGSCISFDDKGKLCDLSNPNNLPFSIDEFNPVNGIPELDPNEIEPEDGSKLDV